MPTKKTRINLSVDDELNGLLEQISRLTGKPKATFVIEILNDSKPMFKDLIHALDMVEQKKDFTPSLAKLAANANALTSTINNEMAEHYSQIDWVERNK